VKPVLPSVFASVKRAPSRNRRPAGQRQATARPSDRASRVPFALLVTSLIVGGLALLLGLNTLSAANELERHNLADKDVRVAAQLQDLHDQVAASAAPDNLARAAEALGMVPAGNPAFLVLGADGSVRVLGSALPVSAPPLPVPPKSKPKPKPTSTKKATKKAKDKKKTHGTTTPTPHTTPTTTTVELPGGNQ
jgi:hypothetical protein